MVGPALNLDRKQVVNVLGNWYFSIKVVGSPVWFIPTWPSCWCWWRFVSWCLLAGPWRFNNVERWNLCLKPAQYTMYVLSFTHQSFWLWLFSCKDVYQEGSIQFVGEKNRDTQWDRTSNHWIMVHLSSPSNVTTICTWLVSNTNPKFTLILFLFFPFSFSRSSILFNIFAYAWLYIHVYFVTK